MNNNLRKKLGLSKKDYISDIKKSEERVARNTPISLAPNIKDYPYSLLNVKTINVGTLKNPVEKLVLYNDETKAFYSLDSLVDSTTFYFAGSNKNINLNGEVLNYRMEGSIDQNNPYDPLFSSFSRLSNKEPITTISGNISGVFQGEQQKFYSLSSGFSKTQNIRIENAGKPVNGIFVPTNTLINGKPRYLNSSLFFPADIVWSNYPSGWFLRQAIRSSTSLSLGWRRFYFNNQTSLPTGQWSSTGIVNLSGTLPLPIGEQFDLEGFFKIATTRISKNKNKIYAILNNNDIVVDNTTGVLPNNAAWVTYPHSYNIQNYPAFRYDLSIHIDSDSHLDRIQDILVISTGISKKYIVYVSPHQLETFAGFWSESTPSNRLPISGVRNKLVSRNIFTLQSGNLLSVTSAEYNLSGLGLEKKQHFVSGSNSGIFSGLFVNPYFYNFAASRLKQESPLSGTLFYKLYEPIYKKGTLKTGTWNGIIPSGTPFSIEVLRTKNAELTSPTLHVYAINAFVNATPSGTGDYQYLKSDEKFFAHGSFEGSRIIYSQKNIFEAEYLASNRANKQAKSKLYGYLWERGFTKTNSKVRKITNLMGAYNPYQSAQLRYCLDYYNPSDPLSCSYTGVNKGVVGIKTSAGIRTNNHLFENKINSGIMIDWNIL